MPRRVIMRIELDQLARNKYTELPDLRGMTQLAITSRLIEWFLEQSVELQAAILGLYPTDKHDLTKAVLKAFLSK